VLTFIDTTSLRRAEERINSRESQLRLAAEAMPEYAIIVTDDAGKVSAWNSGAEKVFGWSAGEMVGENIRRIFTPEDIAAGAQRDEFLQAAQEDNIEESRWHVTKSGERVFCSGVLSRIENAQFKGYVKIARNQTQRELQALRGDHRVVSGSELRREAEAASAMKDDFLAVISHELKNPLNLISVNTEMLSRLPQRPPQMDDALKMIRRAIRGQNKIIDDLLDMSRIRTGKLVLNLEAVDAGAMVCGIMDTARADSSSSGLELHCELPDEPALARADPARLEQIVWNLVSNAVKFTPAGGSISARVVTEPKFVRISISDTGQGIEPHFLPRIFEMFGQAPNRALSGKGGLGIGLALVKQLVERHNGRIEVQSDGLGKGAAFSLWLPRYDYGVLAPPARIAEGVENGAAWQNVRVLIADDSAEAADTLGKLLEMDGAQVTLARDGAQALAEFEKQPFDIVFADIGMPNMDGYELAERLRKLPGGEYVPLVAMTGFTRNADVQHALKAGFDAHIGKPLSIDTLTATMQKLLTKSKDGEGAA
jgi:two-component system CheB/CheR fusion protein